MWNTKDIGSIIKTSSGGTPSRKKPEFYNGDIPWVKTGELKRKYILDSEEHISEEAIEKTSAKLFPTNTVLLAMYGATIGNCSILAREASINQACCAFIPNDLVHHEYLYYKLIHEKRRLVTYGAGAAQPNISQQIIKDYPISYPLYIEQQKIASILSSVDEAIEKTEQIIEQTEQVKKGMMQQLLTKGIGHTEFKDTKIGEIPEDWTVSKIEDILEVAYGKNQKDVEVESSEIPILGTSGIIGWANDYLYDKPSVLIGRKGTINKPQYINKKFWTIDTLFYTKIDETVAMPKFVYFLFQRINWDRYNEATGVPSLSAKNISSVPIILPQKSEQIDIVKIIESFEDKFNTEQEKLSKQKNLKQGLMQQLLTGQVRVSIDEDEEVTT